MYFPSLMGMQPLAAAFEPVDPREAAFQKLFDVHSLKVLASHGQDTFENLYKGSCGDPEYAADYKAALESEKFQATLKQYERMDVGEFMSTYSPMSSREAEALHSIYNKDAIAFSNDPSINDYIIERLQQIANGQDALDPDTDLTDEEKNQKKLAEALYDAFQEAHEERMEEQRKEFTKQQEEFLKSQTVNINGTKASAWDWGRAIDKILGDWDKSYNEMVTKGYAKAGESAKTKEQYEYWRQIMYNDKLSEKQKEELVQQGIRDGKLTQGVVDYGTEKLKLDQADNTQKLTQESAQRMASKDQETSSTLRKADIAADVQPPANSTAGTFTLSASSGIKSSVDLTTDYNIKASEITVEPTTEATPTPQIKASATVCADLAFG